MVENADDCVHITLPAPPAGHGNLSDDELGNAAAGAWSGTFLQKHGTCETGPPPNWMDG